MSERPAPAFLATKLTPPVLPGSLVRRGRLEERLDAAVDGGVRPALVAASSPRRRVGDRKAAVQAARELGPL